MSSPFPVVRKISWIAVIPQFVALVFAVGVGVLLSPAKPSNGMMWGAAAYLLYSFGSRSLIPWHHRAGIALNRQQRFAEAIPCFQRSLEFFERHPWVDRCRSIVLMDPSAMSYREMALINAAFCFVQIGEFEQARSHYERCLARFPDSELATAALKSMDAAGK